VLLRQLRLAAGLSREALAEQAHVSADAVATLERGERATPRLTTLNALADALKVKPGMRANLLRAAGYGPEGAAAGRRTAARPAEHSPPPGRTAHTGPRAAPLPSTVAPTARSEGGTPVPVLLPSKINLPVARQQLVARPGLLERLDAALSISVSLLAAPAGFGKTTLLVEWAARVESRERLAWLSLEEADNDPTRFWTALVSALQAGQIDISVAPALLRDEHSQESVVQQLLGELVSLREQVILVLDDYHVIQTPAIHAGMRYLIEHLPAQLHLVISSRSNPPLPLARMRASGQLAELRALDLRFSLAECEVFLRAVMGLALSGEQVKALDARTEGWPAGLQLAALSLREHPDASAAIAGFTGTHRFIIDYLVEEVLSRLPVSVQTFLGQTSILRQLSGPLCDAVTQGVDGAHRLEELERASLFVTAIDDEHRWYRYHQLFADTLRHRLERQDASIVPALHRRASLWYVSHGATEEAVEHALAGADWDAAADLMDPLFRVLLNRGEQATVRRWLETVPVEVRQTHPALSGRYALALLYGGELSRLDQYLPAAEAAAERNAHLQTLGSFVWCSRATRLRAR
jgi:LuxR family maltose regulon positive regulatory protein